jgi:hypothetical protein
MTFAERLRAAHEGPEYDIASAWTRAYLARCATDPEIARDIERIGSVEAAALLIAAILLRDAGADTPAKLRAVYTVGELPPAS